MVGEEPVSNHGQVRLVSPRWKLRDHNSDDIPGGNGGLIKVTLGAGRSASDVSPERDGSTQEGARRAKSGLRLEMPKMDLCTTRRRNGRDAVDGDLVASNVTWFCSRFPMLLCSAGE